MDDGPGERHVGVVVGLLGRRADAVDELEAGREPTRLVPRLDHADQPLPVGQLLGGDLLAGQRRGVTEPCRRLCHGVPTPRDRVVCLWTRYGASSGTRVEQRGRGGTSIAARDAGVRHRETAVTSWARACEIGGYAGQRRGRVDQALLVQRPPARRDRAGRAQSTQQRPATGTARRTSCRRGRQPLVADRDQEAARPDQSRRARRRATAGYGVTAARRSASRPDGVGQRRGRERPHRRTRRRGSRPGGRAAAWKANSPRRARADLLGHPVDVAQDPVHRGVVDGQPGAALDPGSPAAAAGHGTGADEVRSASACSPGLVERRRSTYTPRSTSDAGTCVPLRARAARASRRQRRRPPTRSGGETGQPLVGDHDARAGRPATSAASPGLVEVGRGPATPRGRRGRRGHSASVIENQSVSRLRPL